MDAVADLREETCRLGAQTHELNRQFGGEGSSTWADPPAKPKWMRWRTYEKKLAAWERIVEGANRKRITLAPRPKGALTCLWQPGIWRRM
jgi:hypothetical protein